jgi:hypothetical protein
MIISEVEYIPVSVYNKAFYLQRYILHQALSGLVPTVEDEMGLDTTRLNLLSFLLDCLHIFCGNSFI